MRGKHYYPLGIYKIILYTLQSPIGSYHNKTAPNATIPPRTGIPTPTPDPPPLFGDGEACENTAVVVVLRWLLLDVVSASTLLLDADAR
jgi:hypothetical protein